MSNYSRKNFYLLRKLILSSLFVAFTYLLGLIPSLSVPIIPVPIVLQNMAVHLAGSILGVWGGFSMLLFLFMLAIGLPMLPGGRGGFQVFFGSSGGFLIGWVIAAFIIGFLVEKKWSKLTFRNLLFINIFGMLIVYMCGIPVISMVTHIPLLDALRASLVFIPLDTVKVIFASLIALLFKKNYPLIMIRKNHQTSVADSSVPY